MDILVPSRNGRRCARLKLICETVFGEALIWRHLCWFMVPGTAGGVGNG